MPIVWRVHSKIRLSSVALLRWCPTDCRSCFLPQVLSSTHTMVLELLRMSCSSRLRILTCASCNSTTRSAMAILLRCPWCSSTNIREHEVTTCDCAICGAVADHTSGSSNVWACIIGIASGMRFVHFNNPISDGNHSALPLVLVDGHQGARVHNRRLRELRGNCRSRMHVVQ